MQENNMKITIDAKFDVGDKVYTVVNREYWERTKCLACEGTGKVLLLDNTYYACPNCNGHKTVATSKRTVWDYIDAESIDGIMIKKCNNKYKYSYDIYCEMFEEEDLFLSDGDAQAECNKRNENTIFTY